MKEERGREGRMAAWREDERVRVGGLEWRTEQEHDCGREHETEEEEKQAEGRVISRQKTGEEMRGRRKTLTKARIREQSITCGALGEERLQPYEREWGALAERQEADKRGKGFGKSGAADPSGRPAGRSINKQIINLPADEESPDLERKRCSLGGFEHRRHLRPGGA